MNVETVYILQFFKAAEYLKNMRIDDGVSSKKQHEKLVAIMINYMYSFFKKRYRISVGCPSKTRQSEEIHRSAFQQIEDISIEFLQMGFMSICEKIIQQKYCLFRKNGFIKFYHFMKKEQKY